MCSCKRVEDLSTAESKQNQLDFALNLKKKILAEICVGNTLSHVQF